MFEVSFILRSEVSANDIKTAIDLAADNWGIDENCLHLITEINVKRMDT